MTAVPVAAFALPGPPSDVRPFGRGHINATFRVDAGGRSFLIQRLNDRVFPDPEAVMDNVARVTSHLKARWREEGVPDGDRRSLTLVPGRDGRTWVRDEGGSLWRCWVFLEGTRSLTKAERPEQAERVAGAYGTFLRLLADLPGPPLRETIPHFQDGSRRLGAFHRALASDPLNRARDAQPEIAALLEHAERASLLQTLRTSEALPLRPTHQDTKLDNVLVDETTGEALCVVDLDTVMPGLALGDFGDLARSACAAASEEEASPQVDPDLFRALVRGFERGLGMPFTPLERELLVEITVSFAQVLALRFLTDHLEGDRYFRIHHPNHNLERARAQIALMHALERARGALEGALRGSRRGFASP